MNRNSRWRWVAGVCVMAMAGLLSYFGLRSKPRPPVVGDLKFPVVVIHDGARVLVRHNADELHRLNVGMAMKFDGWPTLIDSDWQIYSMEKLRSTKSGLWLMANPTGITPISFELTRQAEGGVARARQLIIGCRHLGGDEESKRTALAARTTLAGMIEVLEQNQASSRPNVDSD